MNELKDVLVVTINMMLKPEVIAEVKQSIRQQIKDGVVILPSFCDAKIIHCPENIEVRIESVEEADEHSVLSHHKEDKMLNLRFNNARENGDATADYDVTFTQSFTVEDFLRKYLFDRDEWGYVTINGPFWVPDAKNLLQFNRGEANHINHELMETVRHKIVKEIKASGGWSRMDYELYVDLEGE